MKTRLMLAALLVGVLPSAGLRAADPRQATVSRSDGARLRVEALDEGIVRVWLEPTGVFERAPSLATEAAPSKRLLLSIARQAGRTLIGTTALTVRVDPTLAFDVVERRTGAVVMPTSTIDKTPDDPAWSLSRPLAQGERLMGLGQDNQNNGRLDRRGVVRELWAGQQINSGNVTAEYPIPLLLGLHPDGRAYGLFFDNVHRLRFDLGKTRPDVLRLDAAGGEIDLYVIAGPRLADVIERYTRLTGRPSLPPLWALGYWQSKCTYYDWAALDEASRQLRTRGFPVDVLVIDYDWPEVANNFEWAKRWFVGGKTPAERIAEYRALGVRIVTSQSGPMIRTESPTFAPGWEMGVFASDGRGNPVEAGYYGGKLLDFTHPKINDWLWPQVARRVRDGVAGWWLDLTEPEGEPPQTVYHGGTPANVHNEYSLRCTRSFEGVQLQQNPDVRPWVLTRAGSAGLQRHHAAVWTGDVYSDYATLRAHPPEMLNSGLSGLTWWTSDSGGFMEGYYKKDQMGAHARLYERWMQLSVFSPIARAHKAGGVPEPYQFGPAVEQSTRHYLQLRYRLMPYIYSYAWEASRTGLPIVRPLAVEYQEDERARATPGDEYLFGRELLVAPALYEGLRNRKVYFPQGRWFDWDTGVEYAGGREWVVAAPQNRIPVAVRAGAIIPMAPDMGHTGEKPWDPLTLEVWPSGTSSFTLYRDDGATFGYRRGKFTTTRIVSRSTGTDVRLLIEESNKLFTPTRYVAHLHLERRPLAARSSTGELPVAWDAETRVLTVELDARQGTSHALVVTLDGQPLPARVAPALEADAIDPSGEAPGSVGQPVPHFFPPPALPGRMKAANYDKGGEGVAFHSSRPLPAKTLYRPDDFALAETADVGGGYALTGMDADEWLRYTIDCGNGGWFDVTLRVASAQGGGRIRLMALDQLAAVVDVPVTGGMDVWQDVGVPAVYFNPGELSLMLYVDRPGFRINTIGFTRTEQPPSTYPAMRAARGAFTEILATGGESGRGAVRNLGRIGSSLGWGVVARRDGQATLRLRYQNASGKPLSYTLQVGDTAPVPFELLPSEGWSTFDLNAPLSTGANRIVVRGQGQGWDNVTVEQLELVETEP